MPAPLARPRSATDPRPSTITHRPRPSASACAQARSFAIMPAVAVPLDEVGDRRRRRARASVAPSGVEHARRRARDDESQRAEPRREVSRHTFGVDVEQLGPSRPKPMQAITGTKPCARSIVQQPHVARSSGCRPGRGRPSGRDRPVRRRRSDGGRSVRPRPSGRPPRRRPSCSAATNRVFAAPASTRHDDVERGGVGDAQALDLRASRCRRSCSAASISLPPPWTTTTGRAAGNRAIRAATTLAGARDLESSRRTSIPAAHRVSEHEWASHRRS